jgi:DNA-binding HxlR family transcriptional regulator
MQEKKRCDSFLSIFLNIKITDKMLSLQLRALESDGLVSRTVYPEVPPRVEYELTEEGVSIIPVLEALAAWGKEKGRRDGAFVKVG